MSGDCCEERGQLMPLLWFEVIDNIFTALLLGQFIFQIEIVVSDFDSS